jgi:hypothetical protein
MINRIGNESKTEETKHKPYFSVFCGSLGFVLFVSAFCCFELMGYLYTPKAIL